MKKINRWEFLGSPVVRLGTFTAEGPSSILGQGTKILHAVQRGQKKKKKKRLKKKLRASWKDLKKKHDRRQ